MQVLWQKAIANRLQSAAGGTVGSKGGPGMAAIFGPRGPIILPWTVRGDHFRGGTVHGVTSLLFVTSSKCMFPALLLFWELMSPMVKLEVGPPFDSFIHNCTFCV